MQSEGEAAAPLPTDRQYTDQRREASLGIYDYKACFYSPRLGRFLSADTLVPGVGSQHLSRYMYVRGNPVRRADPDGHMDTDDGRSGGILPRPSPQPQPCPAPIAPHIPNMTPAPTGVPFVGPAIIPLPAPTPISVGTPVPSPFAVSHRVRGLSESQAVAYYDFQGNLPNCGPHSAAMAANIALGRRRFTGAQIAQDMNVSGLKYRIPPNPTNQWGYTFPWGIAAYLNGREGVRAQVHYGASDRDLVISLDKGRVPVVLIEPLNNQAHWMTLYGYDPAHPFPDGTMSPGWGFLNPNNRTLLIDWRTRVDFASRWSGIYVEVWSR